MEKINIRRTYIRIKQRYFNLYYAVIVIAFIIAGNWVWASLNVMQRNFSLQKELDDKSRQLIVAQLDTANAQLEQRYYKTNEYQELAVRQRLNLVSPGERVLILPPNSDAAKKADATMTAKTVVTQKPISNFGQWMNFLFGGNSQSISK